MYSCILWRFAHAKKDSYSSGNASNSLCKCTFKFVIHLGMNSGTRNAYQKCIAFLSTQPEVKVTWLNQMCEKTDLQRIYKHLNILWTCKFRQTWRNNSKWDQRKATYSSDTAATCPSDWMEQFNQLINQSRNMNLALQRGVDTWCSDRNYAPQKFSILLNNIHEFKWYTEQELSISRRPKLINVFSFIHWQVMLKYAFSQLDVKTAKLDDKP